jgi:hypothetical protein
MTRASLRGTLLAGAGVLLLAGTAVAQQATQEQQPLQAGQEAQQGQTGQAAQEMMRQGGQTGQAGQEMMQQGQTGQAGQETAGMGAGHDLSEDGVRRLQEALNQQGHDVGEVDGLWGPQTASALREFQEAQGLEASGEPDEETIAALGLSMDELRADDGTGGAGMGTEQMPTAGGLGAQEGQTEGQTGMQQPGGTTQQ